MLPIALALSVTLAADVPPPAEDKQKIANPGYFDVAACAPHKPELPPTVAKGALTAAVQSARPLVLECLVDPRSRGADKTTKVAIDVTLGDAGAVAKVSGANLTPAGQACAQKALDGFLGSLSGLDAKHAASKDVAAHLELIHTAGVQPAAQLGVNEASDAVAAIRLAEPAWCDCFSPTEAPQAILKGQVKLPKPADGGAHGADVTFEPSGNPAGDKVAACLKGKIAALAFTNKTELQIPLILRFVNGNASGKLPGATPELQFAQYDLRSSALQTALQVSGELQTAAAQRYADEATAYNAKKKGVTVANVSAACKARLDADGHLGDAYQAFLANANETHDFAAEQKAKDPNWAPAEEATAKRVQAVKDQIAKVQGMQDADKKLCASLESAPEPSKSKKKGKK